MYNFENKIEINQLKIVKTKQQDKLLKQLKVISAKK